MLHGERRDGGYHRDDRNNTIILKGKDQDGKVLWYSVDMFDLVPYTVGNLLIDKPLIRVHKPNLDKEMKMALSLDGCHIFYDGHSNYGLGPNFKQDPENLDDYMNISGRGITAIDFTRLIGEHCDSNVKLRNQDYVSTAKNSPVKGVGILKFNGPPNGAMLTLKSGNEVPGHPYNFSRPNERDSKITDYLTIVNSQGDLPVLRYKSCFMASCETGRSFYESLSHGKLLYTMGTTEGTIGAVGSIDGDLLTMAGPESPSIPSGDFGDSWGITHYVKLIIEGKSWSQIVKYFNENQTKDNDGKITVGLYRQN